MFVERLNLVDVEKICSKVLGRVKPYIDEMPKSVKIDRSTSFAVNISWEDSSFLFPNKYIISITDFDVKFYGFELDEKAVDITKKVYFDFKKNRFNNYQKEYDSNKEKQNEYTINIR